MDLPVAGYPGPDVCQVRQVDSLLVGAATRSLPRRARCRSIRRPRAGRSGDADGDEEVPPSRDAPAPRDLLRVSGCPRSLRPLKPHVRLGRRRPQTETEGDSSGAPEIPSNGSVTASARVHVWLSCAGQGDRAKLPSNLDGALAIWCNPCTPTARGKPVTSSAPASRL